MTFDEVINEVHDNLILDLDGYSDEDFVVILKGVVKKFEEDIECTEQEIRFHNALNKKNGQTASN